MFTIHNHICLAQERSFYDFLFLSCRGYLNPDTQTKKIMIEINILNWALKFVLEIRRIKSGHFQDSVRSQVRATLVINLLL